MVRRVLSLLAVVLLAASCAYESAGTTTTTEVVAEDQPPATGPAAISIVDQRIEGSSLVVDSATLPAPGFVIAREDDGGSPGAVIGVSELLPVGVVQDVPVPFFVPISEPLVVHVTVQIDMDQNGMFTYDPPEFVDDDSLFGALFAHGGDQAIGGDAFRHGDDGPQHFLQRLNAAVLQQPKREVLGMDDANHVVAGLQIDRQPRVGAGYHGFDNRFDW